MKKIIFTNIKKELSKLINKKGINLDKYFKKEISNSKFNITFQEFMEIVEEEKEFIINKQNNFNLIQINEDFYKSKEYYIFEEELYNWNYMKTLFREELNLNILLIFKLIKDLGEVNYSEICNNLKRIMNINLDIKQISHYCKEIKVMNLIFSDSILTLSNERLVKPKKIEYLNLSKKKFFEDCKNSFENEYLKNDFVINISDGNSVTNIEDNLKIKGIRELVNFDIDKINQDTIEKSIFILIYCVKNNNFKEKITCK